MHIPDSQKGLAWKAVAQPHLPKAVLAQSHRDWGCLLVLPPESSNVSWETEVSCNTTFASVLRKCERLQIAVSQKGLAWKAVAQPHLPMALISQRLGLLACLATSNFKCSMGNFVSQPGSFRSPAPKVRTSADSWQPEGARMESCCSASSAHGTARTEAQRLGLLAYLAT